MAQLVPARPIANGQPDSGARRLELSFRFDAQGEDSLQVLWEDGERVFCRGWRPGAGCSPGAVLVVLPAGEHPSPANLGRLVHEYGLRDELDGVWAVHPLELVRDSGRIMLVLENPGGEPLERLLGAPMEMGRFLRLAIGIVTALGKAHQRGLVHKDLKPANILVNCADGEVRLTGFGIASRLPRERQALAPPEVVAGTLAYMAPEQTGRMNRSVDSRSDLYALGVTLYQMLTGSLPFSAADPLEWIHCHVARQPVPPGERAAGIPGQVSSIVMKLLAKAAEDRYQTAEGGAADLRRCLEQWNAAGHVDPFPLGTQDVCDRLVIPEKLYGRERETGALLAAFDRVVTHGTPELVLLSGYSGIGKSSVANELHKVLVPPRGLFAAGKFDQYKRDIPHATLAQALQTLVRQILSRSETELWPWRDAVREAVGANGQLVVNLIPELELLIGPQPAVAELPPQDAQNRFHLVFCRFLAVLARPEHPLVLFLDDLQWLDTATLELFAYLITRAELRHFLLVGAYRDNEVGPVHPLTRMLEAVRKSDARIQELVLAPLRREDVRQLVADTLHCGPERAEGLSRLVHDKTGGNPFFAIQFLTDLVDRGLIAFDRGPAVWTWDLDGIRAEGHTDSLVDLMVGKLTRLPATTREALKELALLGNVAATATLALVCNQSEEALDAALLEAMRAGLVFRSDGAYAFAHDRIQEAAYSLIPESERAAEHLRIGRLVASRTAPLEIEEKIFEIVNQFNRGAELITLPDERERLAELDLIAGRRARRSTAYAAALNYLAMGRALLAPDSWERRYELTFALEFHQAESEYLTGDLAAAEERLSMLSHRPVSRADLAAVTRLRVDLFTTLDRSDRAVEAGLAYLRSVGVVWSTHPTMDDVNQEFERIWQQLGSRPIRALIDLPFMEDPGWQAQMDVLTALLPPALFTDENLFSLIVARMANVSMEHGNTHGSCLAYVWLGLLLGPHFDKYPAAFRFGQLGLDLVEKRGLTHFRARVYLDFSHVVNPWMQHAKSGPGLVRRALNAANEIGDLTFAAYSSCNLISALLAAGAPLAEVQQEAERQLEFARQLHFGLIVDIITGQLRMIMALRGLTSSLASFEGPEFAESQFERRLDQDPGLTAAIGWYWVRKLQGRVFARDEAGAMAAAARVEPFLWTIPSHLETADYHFYAPLARAASYASAPAQDQPGLLHALRRHQAHLAIWAENCPENFKGRHALVSAELARIEGREMEAMRLYGQAVASARDNGLIHDEAIANESAARFYAARGFETISHAYLRNARDCYVSWGADGKVRQLDRSYPQLKDEPRLAAPTGTIGAAVEQLDLATVIKVSQAVSSEIVFEKLLDRLMRTALEYAGAQRGLLTGSGGAEQRIAAEATTSGDSVVVQLRDEPVAASMLPESVLHQVLRTRDSVILDDAAAQSPFAADPYVIQHQARSVLCLPLLNQTRLIGVLYLENNLAPRVFAPGRIAVLKLLASQAAISLENTRLYRDLAEREARIRRLVDANIIGIAIWNLEGQVLDANDAILRMVGYDREDLVSGRLRWADLTPPDWRDQSTRVIEELKATGSVPPYEKEYFRKDGSRVPVLVGAASFEAGGDQGVAFVLDLTERKRAEAALRDSEEQWKAVFENNPTMYFMVDPTGTIISVNPFGAVQLGYTTNELIGRSVAIVYHEADREYGLRNNALCFERRDQTMRWELRKVRKNGEVIWVRQTAKATLIRDRPVLLTVCEDITEGKRAAEALREVQTELAHANRVAAMGQLTASIAHEVTQPVAAAIANAQAALRWLGHSPPELEEVRQALGRIVENGTRAGDVIGRIRALIRKAPPREGLFDLNEAVRDVIVLTRSEVLRHRVSLQTELATDLSLIEGDRVQLQQVILNLIINAIEAMSVCDGARELLIRTAEPGPDTVSLAVQDSGPGLDLASPERVFEAFYTTKPDGLGMGLSICRSIVEAHGGRLEASANMPHGAIFQFTVPVRGKTAFES